MSDKQEYYQVVDRGEALGHFVPGGWVFFRRPLETGGGYWLGRTYADYFWLEFEHPISLATGLEHLVLLNWTPPPSVDDFELT